jgi:AcrR family transcriptional regulator
MSSRNMPTTTPNKHQLKNQRTHEKLLRAAETIFVRDGYEGAQLSTIAAAAGKTKGAVYDHFKSKEDLFFELFESRVQEVIAYLDGRLKGCRNRKESLAIFREFCVGLASDKTWPILTLEFKLFALRHAESKNRLRKALLLIRSSGNEGAKDRVFGRLKRREKSAVELSLSAIGPIASGLILESYFEPKNLSEKGIRQVLGRVFDALF